MRVHAWMGFPLLICGIWFLKCSILLPTKLRNPKMMCRETCCRTHHQENTPRTKLRLQFSTTILNCARSIVFPETLSLLNLVRCSTFFEDNEAMIKMIIKSRSPTMRHVSRTHRVRWIGCLIGLVWTRKIRIKFVDTKNQLADMLTKGQFHTR